MIELMPFGDFRSPGRTRLTGAIRETLRSISVTQQCPAGTVLFEQGAPATYLFNVLHGVAYSERRLPDGSRRGMAFLFPGDLCGLARRGVYVNSVSTLTPTTVLRMPFDSLTTVMLRNADVQFHFLCKVAHIVRQLQRQMLLLARKDPVERVALFVSMLRNAQARAGSRAPVVPVTPAQMASYLDLGVATVDRALERLASDEIVTHEGKNGFRVINARKLQRLVSQAPAEARPEATTRGAAARGRVHNSRRASGRDTAAVAAR